MLGKEEKNPRLRLHKCDYAIIIEYDVKGDVNVKLTLNIY